MNATKHTITAISVGALSILLPHSFQAAEGLIPRWERSYGAASNEFLFGIADFPDGGFLLAGYSNSESGDHKTSVLWGQNDYWVICVDSNGLPIWDRSIGGTDHDLLTTVQRTAQGYILGGTSLSDTNGNKTAPNMGLRDYWIVQLDTQGTVGWQKSYGGSGSDYLQDLTPTPDGGFLLGGYSFSGTNGNKTSLNHGLIDYWIVKTDGNGDPIWDQSFGGGGNDYFSKLALTEDGGCILAGYSFSIEGGNKTSPRHGGSDYWILRLDPSGNKLWDRTFGGSLNEYCQGVLALADGGFLIGGYSLSPADGNKSSAPIGMSDYWVVKLDASGSKIWESAFGGSGDDNAWSLAPLPNGEFMIAGWSDSPSGEFKNGLPYGRSDFWLVMFNGNGDLLRDYSSGGDQDEVVLAIQPTLDGGSVVGGYSFSGPNGSKTSPNHGESDFWIIRYDAESVAQNMPILSVSHQLSSEIASQGFRFTLRGQPGQTYILEYSVDLTGWTAFATNTLAGSEVEIMDPNATPGSRRYYRAMEAE